MLLYVLVIPVNRLYPKSADLQSKTWLRTDNSLKTAGEKICYVMVVRRFGCRAAVIGLPSAGRARVRAVVSRRSARILLSVQKTCEALSKLQHASCVICWKPGLSDL